MIDDMPVSESALSWSLVIEALAGMKEVDTSIVRDLIDVSPVQSNEITETTTELFALRILESVVRTGNGNTVDGGSKLDIDFSKSCAHVLYDIMEEVGSVPDFRTYEALLSKFDLQPFVTQKRACMNKCALQQLKEAILRGAHPGSNQSKNKRGLTLTTEDHGVRVSAEQIVGCNTGKEQMETSNEGLPAEGASLVPAGPENAGEQMLKENLRPFKRIRVDKCGDNGMEQYHKNQQDASECNLTTANVIKHCATSDVESRKENGSFIHENQPPKISCTELHCARIGDDATEKDSIETLKQGVVAEDSFIVETAPLSYCHDQEKIVHEVACSSDANREAKGNSQPPILGYNQMLKAKLQYERIRIDTDDENVTGHFHDKQQDIYKCQVISAKKIKPYATSNASKQEHDAYVHESNLAENVVDGAPMGETQNKLTFDDSPSNTLPSAAYLNNIEQNTVRNESENDASHCSEEGRSSDCDGLNDDVINLATRKDDFLSSQCTSSHDFSYSGGWSGQNLCMKCGEGSELLSCSSDTCPLVIHAHCLGTAAEFDDARGNFYCPFCVYSRAISEYLEAKRKCSSAKEYLAKFLDKRKELQREEVVNVTTVKVHNSSGDILSESVHKKSNETELLVLREENQENHDSEHVHKISNDHLQKNRQMKPSSSRANVNLSCEKEDTGVDRANILDGKRDGGQKESEDTQSVRELDERRQVPVNYEEGTNKNFREKTNSISPLEEYRGQEIQQDLLKPEIANQLNKSASVPYVESDEISESEFNTTHSRRCTQKPKPNQYPASPQFRRKKVPWTLEEEEVLKMGVLKFSNVHERWKKILELGGNVFQKGRKPADLKDKWRNMCKTSSK